jgi:hypothetical protein
VILGFSANAQQSHELSSYIEKNSIVASEHFGDLLYGSVGSVDISEGPMMVKSDDQPKSFFIKMSDINLLEGALQEYPSVEFVQVNVSDCQRGKVNLTSLSSDSKVKYILFFSTEPVNLTSLLNSVEGLSADSTIVNLYQISRPG